MALVQTCTQASNGLYKTDSDSSSATVAICSLNGAYFWTADMDVDCDGLQTAHCNLTADPDFQAQTSFTDAAGNYFDAAALPYVVIPLPSSRFDYMARDIQPGAVVAVIYSGQLEYAIFGDEGPDDIIGEASYATANALGVDPDPSFGGTDGPVTYIVFTGQSAAVADPGSHAQAVTLGQQLAAQLIQDN